MLSNLIHTRNYFLGSILIKALGFISIPFFTNYLTVAEFGMMSVYTAIVSFMSTFLSLGVLGAFKRYYFEEKNDYGSFLYSNIIMLIGLDIIIVSILFYYNSGISNLLDIPQKVFGFTLIASILTIIVKIYLDLLQVQEDSLKQVVFNFIKTLSALLLSISFVLLLSDDKYMGRVYGDLAGFSIIALYSIIKLSKLVKKKFKIEYLKYSLLFGLPVLPSMFSSFGLAFADRLMINKMTSTEDAGLYSFAYSVAMIVQATVIAISNSWQPLFYKKNNEKKHNDLNKTFVLNTKIVYLFSFIVIIFSYELIYILANKEYMNTQTLIIYIVVGFNFFYLYTMYGQYTSYLKKTFFNSVFILIAVSINVYLNYVFIPIYGYEVSAIVTTISYIVLFLLFYMNAKYFLKIKVLKISYIIKITIYYILILFTFIFINNSDITYLIFLPIKFFLLAILTYSLYKDAINKNNIKKYILNRDNW